jgi:hypothetical protein
VIITCAHCGQDADKLSGGVNRSRKAGLPLYCGRKCAGLAKRVERTAAERRQMKSEYDRQRRAELADKIKADKRAAYQRDRPARLAAMAARRACPDFRVKMKAYQHEWARRPAVKAAKKQYDRRWRAVREFGQTDLAEVVILLGELSEALRPMKRENMANKGRVNLCLNRKRRAYAKE